MFANTCGAERLVVDAAVGLQNQGHQVVMYTSHHDPSHCFEETRDGTLTVRVGGNTIVPRTLFGRFYIICAILRNIHLALSMLVFNNHGGQEQEQPYDVIIVDQLSVSIPILRWTGSKIFFYCHFPDKLLTKRETFLKKLYRLPVDFIEEVTTGMADTIVVNSKFTAGIFKESFRMLRHNPEVLYPSIQFEAFDKEIDSTLPEVKALARSDRSYFLSINRYERKKDINLAIHAFAQLLKGETDEKISEERRKGLRLIVAGGYDIRVAENVEHHQELVHLAEQSGLKTFTLPAGADMKTAVVPKETEVLFLQSISNIQKLALLQEARALLYTPTNEHFGIVPVEAMYMRCPVVAVNSGGPTESIDHGVTGYLCPAESKAWAKVLAELIQKTDESLKAMGEAGHARVIQLFSLNAFVAKLGRILEQLMDQRSMENSAFTAGDLRSVFLFTVIAMVLSYYFYRP
ncbi:Alpha-1,3-mannosyltransferase-like protein [Lunasporangiospora selenospora]|uniref:Alpha-1,3/1,6-mannosyltransferase ALG2 n=1 Tax=Lunasporangiospora selenospora TaxID=979761 RepID=A0A9P6FTP9_9FUNG|nr:Alpha-1,3-mannosyltransferase-like protein [Lunasporangiospora selenospora]